MAAQVQTITQSAQDRTEGYSSEALSTLDAYGDKASAWSQEFLDRYSSPNQRAALWTKLQDFTLTNPKIFTFLAINIALTGVPLSLFILFSSSVVLSSVLGGVMLGLFGAFLFTLFWVGFALCILLPVIFVTTMTACFLFLWGMAGYYVLRWLNGTNDERRGENKPLSASGSIRALLNPRPGERPTGSMDSARAEKINGYGGFSRATGPS